MRIVMFYHSLLSDWNHGNAHFLRGIATELSSRGHQVEVYEPADSWSLRSLRSEHGEGPIQRFKAAYPLLTSLPYDPETVRLEEALQGAELVIVHEWNDHMLVKAIGELRRSGDFVLLFHDTHHRMVSQPDSMAAYDLGNYDGVLAYGEVLRELYELRGNVRKAWTWHEAADTRVFKPLPGSRDGDLVWIGNWGDDERTAELHEFLIGPARDLRLRSRVYGVRYPEEARAALQQAGIDYGGWLPNFDAPRVFADFKFTVHVPRRPYVKILPGIPTIRPFEALACGIPLICSPWNDSEGMFRPGTDYLVANSGDEMKRHMRSLREDHALRDSLSRHGLETILKRHTCAHRVNELLAIHEEVAGSASAPLPVNHNKETVQAGQAGR